MKVSVIIPTYKGGHKLGKLLKALEMQTLHGFEVVVAVDGSTDHTLQLLKGWKPQNFRLVYKCQANRGRAAIRNFGAKHAEGDLLIFLDDDMRPAPSCLALHLNHHKDYPGSVATAMQIEDKEMMVTDIQKYKLYLSSKWYQPFENVFLQTADKFFFTAANCSLSAKDFDEIGGFDERLKDAEDYDFGRRAMAAGKKVFFLKNALAFHDDYITAKSYLTRLRQYKEAQIKVAKLNPAYFEAKKENMFVKKMMYNVFGFSFWVDLIDRESFLWVPKKIRFKLYDIIFTSQIECGNRNIRG